VDFHASLAELAGRPLKTEEQKDSQYQLAALLGDRKTGRASLIEDANGQAVRAGTWKYIPPRKGPKRNANTNTELGNDPQGLLFDLATDPGETKNLITEHPEKVTELTAILEKTRSAGRLP
jgi:arylsulfatase A-like enzyme